MHILYAHLSRKRGPVAWHIDPTAQRAHLAPLLQGADIVCALVPAPEARRRLLKGLAGVWALPVDQAVEWWVGRMHVRMLWRPQVGFHSSAAVEWWVGRMHVRVLWRPQVGFHSSSAVEWWVGRMHVRVLWRPQVGFHSSSAVEWWVGRMHVRVLWCPQVGFHSSSRVVQT